MIELSLPLPLLWTLRWLLFLAPLAAVLVLGWHERQNSRALVAGLFAFLYGLGLIFVTHAVALQAGWWRYGGDTLMILGLPADIWIGGALLFGPVLYLAFPNVPPPVLLLPIVLGLHGTVFSSLRPLVVPGLHWYAGVLAVFATAHLPALYLARWTVGNRHLPLRAALLALGYGCLAFAVLPTVIMQAMGGAWSLSERPIALLAGGVLLSVPCCVLGLTAVQMFVLHGRGTPIPLDPTQRLVRSGIFAYIRNPMQLCTALVWIIEGIFLQNIWVASAALMAWVFVAGMVRWHHRYDLLVRFPEEWPEYAAQVPEWRPRWRPWIKERATLHYDPGNAWHAASVGWLTRARPLGLDLSIRPGGALAYCEGPDRACFSGMAALAAALGHTNFALAMAGAAGLLMLLPAGYLMGLRLRRAATARLDRAR